MLLLIQLDPDHRLQLYIFYSSSFAGGSGLIGAVNSVTYWKPLLFQAYFQIVPDKLSGTARCSHYPGMQQLTGTFPPCASFTRGRAMPVQGAMDIGTVQQVAVM